MAFNVSTHVKPLFFFFKGYTKSVTNGELGKKTNEDRRKHSSCPKASNPYHECNDSCHKGISTGEPGFTYFSFLFKIIAGSLFC